jgi:predicted HAD superfamily Cof-like phosphohydrolase
MNKEQKDVLTFHKAMGLEWTDKPQMLKEAAMNRRIRLIESEFDETIEAYEKDDLIGMIDGLVDLLYVTYGTATELGVDLEEFWQAIHDDNMTKVGGPKNEFGKQLKPEGYKHVDLEKVYEKYYGKIPEPAGWDEERAIG